MNHTDAHPRPDGPLYAVGDLHGCAGLLDRMLGRIETDLLNHGLSHAKLVLLGDYVDRGDNSRDVLHRLFRFSRKVPDSVVCLMGNHEEMMLRFLDDPTEKGPRWLRHGGLETLLSFGVGGVTERSKPAALADAANRLRAAFPDGLEDWIRGLPYVWVSGDVACVHAALDPSMPPHLQAPRDMAWGHPKFYRQARRDDLWVIHGHDVVDNAFVLGRRVAVDTGACHSGRLTAAAIHPGRPIRFLEVRA